MKPVQTKSLDAFGASIAPPPGTKLVEDIRTASESKRLFTLEGDVEAAAGIERHLREQLTTSGFRVSAASWNGTSFAIKAAKKGGARCEVDAFSIAPELP